VDVLIYFMEEITFQMEISKFNLHFLIGQIILVNIGKIHD